MHMNVQAKSMVFEQEIYDQFTYKRDRSFFHSFPGDVSSLTTQLEWYISFSFPNVFMHIRLSLIPSPLVRCTHIHERRVRVRVETLLPYWGFC